MADEPSPSNAASVAGTTSTWLSLAISALSLAEKLLPAFLMAWNNAISEKNKQLKMQLAKAQLDSNVTAFEQKQKDDNAQKTSAQVLDGFLGGNSSGGGDIPKG